MLVLLLIVLSLSSENPWYRRYATLCIVLKQSKLQRRPLDHRLPPSTRAASCKPALVLLKVLINLRTLVTPKMPVNLINSVILRTQLTQNNTNHLLGFRGMRTWPCVDATQAVNIWLGFDCPRLVVVVAQLSQKHADSLAFQRLVPLSF